MEKANITIMPTKIEFTKGAMKIFDIKTGKYTLPYSNIFFAYLTVYVKETDIYYIPEITEISAEMDGKLMVYDCQKCLWKIETDLMENTAGKLLIELSLRAPFILIGRQTWFDMEDETSVKEIKKMVKLMHMCE